MCFLLNRKIQECPAEQSTQGPDPATTHPVYMAVATTTLPASAAAATTTLGAAAEAAAER